MRCIQTDGCVARVAVKLECARVNHNSIQHNGSGKANWSLFCQAKIIYGSKLNQRTRFVCISFCKTYFCNNFLPNSIHRHIFLFIRFRNRIDFRPLAAVPFCIEGLLHNDCLISVIDDRVFHNCEYLILQSEFFETYRCTVRISDYNRVLYLNTI